MLLLKVCAMQNRFYLFFAVCAMLLLACGVSTVEARSHFLPNYQTGGFSFDNSEDISVACPTSTFAYTKDNCTYPNTPQYSCGGRYRVCGCDRDFAYSAAQCKAMGKVGGDQSCTVRGGSDSGTVYYTTCKCPSSYPKLTTGQKCVGGTECSYAGEKYCDSTSHIQCESNYKVCDQNKSGRSGSCTAGGVTKYIDCYCDENLYPQTNETCKADFGANAVVSGEICGNNERGKSCSCEPNALPDGYSESCGSQGYSASIDDGCGGTYYKCNDAGCGDSNYCGKTCQNKVCVCPSGQVDNNGTCETPNCANGSITCGDGQTCNETTKVCEATTRDCQVGDIFYSDKTCSNTYLASKTPVGIVVDPQNRLLVDLTETNNIMAAPGMPGSVNGGFPQFINVGNEMPMNASECGLDNTIEIIDQTRNYSPARICFQKTNSALEGGRWYVPATRELFRLIISGNLEKVNTMLQMLSQHLSTAKIIENKIWSSDEVRGDTAGANMLVYNPHGSSTALVPTAKNATDVYFRCMARYKCPEGSADCTITPLVVITNPMQGYVAGGAPCVPPYFQEIFAWNTNYTRCVWDESSGGGSTDPQKTPCQTNDSMYCSGNNCFCTTASSDLYYKNATYMGKIGNLGLVIIGQVGSTSSVSDAENQCNNFSRENFSNWRIPYTSDASNWSSIIWNVGHPYAKSGSLSVYWDGYGWNSQVSNNRWGTLYCTHNYSNIYRE